MNDERQESIKSEMLTYYDERAPEYDDWYERRNQYHDPGADDQWADELAVLDRAAASFGRGRVLEVACGTGRWTAHLAANPAVEEVVAVDASPAMLAAGRARVVEGAEKVRWVRADAYDLPFAAGEFDAFFAGFFLSHVPPEEASDLLSRFTGLLRPGGEAGLFDSLLPEGAEPVQVQRRTLTIGSTHNVLKVYYTADTLNALLSTVGSGVRTVHTGKYFVAGWWAQSDS